MSALCLGAMTFSENAGEGASPAVARKIFDHYRDAGGNFIDTANIYSGGGSERLVGEFARSERDALVIASKYSMSTRPDAANCSGNHRKNMVQALEASLQRLRTDYLDILWVHGWDGRTRIDELMRALDDLVRAGKVLHLGVSNFPAWLISHANTLAMERNMTAFTAVQMHYNLVERSIETDFFELCAAQDMAITAWSPLAAGLLTGKFNRDASADVKAGSDARLNRAEYGPAMLAEHRLAVAEQLSELAAECGCSPPQLALAWLLQRPQGRVVPILGARTLAQFEDNLQCLSVDLDHETISALDSLSPPARSYPASLFATDFYTRMMHGNSPPAEI